MFKGNTIQERPENKPNWTTEDKSLKSKEAMMLPFQNAKKNMLSSLCNALFKEESINQKRKTAYSNSETKFWKEFDEVVQECAVPDWDAYGALPLKKESVNLSRHFLETRPYYMTLPELSPDAEGDLGLYWSIHKYRILMSIDEKGVLSYAWTHPRYGKHKGSVPYRGCLQKR